jgi:transcriptional regulator GlxA family with amidase domain
MNYKIKTLINFLQENLHLNFTIEELAQSVNLSESGLQHLFKKQTGVSVIEYFRQLKLEKAAELLTTTFLLIKQIRLEVGISNPRHFRKYFKEKFQMTPRAYRKKNFDLQKAQQIIADKIAEFDRK